MAQGKPGDRRRVPTMNWDGSTTFYAPRPQVQTNTLTGDVRWTNGDASWNQNGQLVISPKPSVTTRPEPVLLPVPTDDRWWLDPENQPQPHVPPYAPTNPWGYGMGR